MMQTACSVLVRRGDSSRGQARDPRFANRATTREWNRFCRIAQACARSASRRLAQACVLTPTRAWEIDTSDAMPAAQHDGGFGDGLELLLCDGSGRDGVVGKRSETAIGME